MDDEVKHTAGPWAYKRADHPTDGEYDFAVRAGGKVIAEAFGRVDHGEAGKRPAEANARLMAAAPELLAALKAFAEASEEFPSLLEPLSDLVDDARAAIAKAEGRAP